GQLALRARFDAHAALFANDVALLVKFSKDGIVEALRFEQKPKLQAITREIIEVIRGVLAGAGVQADATVGFDQLGIGVGNDEAVGLFHGGLERLLEIGELLRIGLEAFVALGVVLIV